MILDSPIITGSLLQQAGQFAEIPRYTDVSSSLLSVSASLNAKINALTTDTGSQASRLSNLETKSSSVDISITNLNTFTQSFSQSVATSFSSSNASITSLSASVASVTGDFSSSVATSFSQSNSSLTTLSASVSTSFSQSNASITSLSASVANVTGNFSSSVATSFSQSNATITSLSSSVNTRISGLASFTGSYATTGSNTFYGNQVVSASVYVQGNLIVLGTSSMQNITGSSVSIGTNTVVLNTSNPAVRFGGISVQDSGSSGGTGSLWWDSLNNNWLYQNPSGLGYTSAKLISGPQNTGSLGNEQGLTTGKIVYAVGDDHIGDSIMTQTTGKITLSGDLDVTGNISSSTLSGIGNVTNFSQSVSTRFAGLSNVTSSYETTGRGIWSGSAQLPTGVISGSSQLTASYDTRYVASGSITQTTWDNIASKPGGIISGAVQVTSSLDLRYRLIGTPVTFDELDGKPTLVSGSLQFRTLTDAFTGSFTGSFKGDGSLLTGLTAGGKIHTQTTPASTWTFTHNLNVQYPNVTVYSTSGQIVLPQSITATDINTLVLEFGTNVAGYAVAGIGGIIEVQGRTVRQNFTSSLSWRFEHNFGDRFVNIQTFDSNYEKIIPQTIVLTDNTSSLITFPEATSGWAVGTIGGDLPSINSTNAGYVLQVSNTSPYTASWTPVADVTASNAINAISASRSQLATSVFTPSGTANQFLYQSAGGAGSTTTSTANITYDSTNTSLNATNIGVGSTGTFSSTLDRSNNISMHDGSFGKITIRNNSVDKITIYRGGDIVFSGSIIPATSGSYDLGSISNPFRHIYVGTGSIYLVDDKGQTTRTISAQTIVTTDTLNSGSISLINSLPTGTVSGSSQVTGILSSLNTYTSSINTWSSSLATTGSNTFKGTQIISGSTYVQGDLIVLGSSSIQYISASSVSIGTNIVNLNTATPGVRYAGISVQDSGSSAGVTGSILWDSLCNRWLYSNPSGVGYSGGIIMSGPRAATFGTETTLTCNYIAKSGGGDHLYDSCIWEMSGSMGINTNSPFGNLHVSNATEASLFITSTGGDNDTSIYLGYCYPGNQLFCNTYIKRQAANLVFGTSANTRLTIGFDGTACFACGLSAKTLGTNDLILNNLNYECANYVDGTRGSWLIQEGENDLFIINQISCKKYKFNLIEIK